MHPLATNHTCVTFTDGQAYEKVNQYLWKSVGTRRFDPLLDLIVVFDPPTSPKASLTAVQAPFTTFAGRERGVICQYLWVRLVAQNPVCERTDLGVCCQPAAE